MNETIPSILKLAVNAPSGDNSQPWEFCIKDRTLYVQDIVVADETIYNYRHRGSYLSHGALIENIVIAASSYGLRSEIKIFPRGPEHCCIAKIDFIDGGQSDPLASAIPQRTTNRKPYSDETIGQREKEQLLDVTKLFSGFTLQLLEGKEPISKLAKILSLNERLILEHRGIHDGLFSYIRWSDEEEREKGGGLNIKTLELAPPQQKAFKMFKNWGLLSVLNKMLGIAKLVAKDNVRLYASSPLFGMIYMQDDQPTDFIDAGRCLERVWLTATRLGLHIQPTAALLYLAQRAREGEGSFFSKTHQELILKAESSIKTIFDVPQGKVPVMLMRIGKGDAPTVRSYKRPPHLLSDIECAKNNI